MRLDLKKIVLSKKSLMYEVFLVADYIINSNNFKEIMTKELLIKK